MLVCLRAKYQVARLWHRIHFFLCKSSSLLGIHLELINNTIHEFGFWMLEQLNDPYVWYCKMGKHNWSQLLLRLNVFSVKLYSFSGLLLYISCRKLDYFHEVLSQMRYLLISLRTNTVFSRQSPSCPLFVVGEIDVLRF